MSSCPPGINICSALNKGLCIVKKLVFIISSAMGTETNINPTPIEINPHTTNSIPSASFRERPEIVTMEFYKNTTMKVNETLSFKRNVNSYCDT